MSNSKGQEPYSSWDNFSDTWVATDALGRTLPVHEQVGPPRGDKIVALFYFTWLGQHGLNGPYDITNILQQDPDAMNKPDSPLWGAMEEFHHWGESVFGYYLSTDEWVIRRHAQMLADAGVDVIIMDTTNLERYTESYMAICRVFARVRSEGGRTPQIAFLTPFGDPSQVVFPLFDEFYAKGDYSDLWFLWQGKPLILADPDLLGSSSFNRHEGEESRLESGHTQGQFFTAKSDFAVVGALVPTWGTDDSACTLSLYKGGIDGRLVKRQHFENIIDDSGVAIRLEAPLPPGDYYLEQSEPSGQIGWWSYKTDALPDACAVRDGEIHESDRSLILLTISQAQILDFFTFRKPMAGYFFEPTGKNQWSWLEVFPQHVFPSDDDPKEMMAVGVAQNAVQGRLGALSNPQAHGRSFSNGEQPPPSRQDFTGKNFQEQWDRAFEVDPTVVFVTGWNEWIAQRFGQDDNSFEGRGPVTFVDLFNREYSRDIEPMQGGHEDAFYLQFVANVRRFKGARALLVAAAAKTIDIRGESSQWDDVSPEYRDDRFDTEHRNTPGWGSAGQYVNLTGRNDFIRSKVACDEENLYFYVQTREPISPASGHDWMRLLLDTEGDGRGAFLSFNFSINRARTRPGFADIESISHDSNGAIAYLKVGEAAFHISGTEMQIAVPRRLIGVNGVNISFNFKWTDNVDAESDAMNLYRNGDTAPNGRFAYRYTAGA